MPEFLTKDGVAVSIQPRLDGAVLFLSQGTTHVQLLLTPADVASLIEVLRTVG